MLFVAKEFKTVLNNLLTLFSKEVPIFNNYTNDDPIVLLLKLIAMLSESSSEYVIKYFNSKYIQQSASIDSKSMYLLLESFNRTPIPIIPSTVNVTYEYLDDSELGILVPRGTAFTVNDVNFTILDDHYLRPANNYLDITLIEGTYRLEEFTGNLIVDNKLQLSSESVALDYVAVEVDGKELTKIQNCKYSTGTNIFSSEYDIFGNYNVVFPTNYIDFINDTSNISVRYIESTGNTDFDPLEGNIQITSNITFDGEDITDNFRLYTIVNYLHGTVKYNENYNYLMLPYVLTTFNAAITINDYENLINYLPGVAICAAYDINSPKASDPLVHITTPYVAKIVVAPSTGFIPSNYLKEYIMDYIYAVGLDSNRITYELLDPTYHVINLRLGVKSSYTRQSDLLNVYNSVNKSITDYFAIGNIKFGSYISKDHIASYVSKADESISFVDVLDFDGYQLGATELPILGAFTIIFSYNSLSVNDTMNITDNKTITAIFEHTGDNGEIMYLIDTAAINLQVSDTINTTSIDDTLYFSYSSHFEIEISEQNDIFTEDHPSSRYRQVTAYSNVKTNYENSASLDDTGSIDDELESSPIALITDTVPAYDRNYNF